MLLAWLAAVFGWVRDFLRNPPPCRRRTGRVVFLEPLECRVLLSGTPPSATPDSYEIPYDSFDTAALNLSSVLANDIDMELDPLTAVLNTGVSHGTLTLNSNGHFVYEPEAGYVGGDVFSYKAFDGTGYSSAATVSLTVSTTFGPANNLDDLPTAPAQDMETFGVSLLTGGVEAAIVVAPGHALVYQSTTDPKPVIGVETTFASNPLDPGNGPSSVTAQLTVGSVTGSTLYYNGSGLVSGWDLRFAH